MTWRVCGADPEPRAFSARPLPRLSGDGSFSLFCPQTGEAFHSADGAVAEAQRVFVQPAALERFVAGSRLRVVEVAVGTGTNTAALIEAATSLGLQLEWWGLELDPAPLELALADASFQGQWRPDTLECLRQLVGSERLLWGDARQRVADLLAGRCPAEHPVSGATALAGAMDGPPSLHSDGLQGCGPLAGRCDLVLLDAFSPRRCPGLWSQEFLGRLAQLLQPNGRLLTYSSAAAVRRALDHAGLHLAAIAATAGASVDCWSAGTVASPSPLPGTAPLRPLTPMEQEHLVCRAGETYRDPTGMASAAAILAERQQRQACSSAESAGQWQRRWGIARRHSPATFLGLAPSPARPQV